MYSEILSHCILYSQNFVYVCIYVDTHIDIYSMRSLLITGGASISSNVAGVVMWQDLAKSWQGGQLHIRGQ